MAHLPPLRLDPIAAVALLFALLFALAGCAPAEEPLRASRPALGTVVAITAYPSPAEEAQPGDTAPQEAIEAAYDAMAAVEDELDAHDPASVIGRLNAEGTPSTPLPERASATLDAIDALGVRTWFSPQLFAVMGAWAFESGGRIPSADELAAALADMRWDFGGAAKGLALDEAARAMRDNGSVPAALISSSSTTLVFGAKPDGTPWRIGVEDPRDGERVVATVEATGDLTVSTSGDYQRFFESGGVRYHHIVDPATGMPVRGIRSLTVIADIPGLHSDILSTALFVAGPDEAIAYAERHGLGLVLVDDEGRTRIVPGPEGRSWEIAETSP